MKRIAITLALLMSGCATMGDECMYDGSTGRLISSSSYTRVFGTIDGTNTLNVIEDPGVGVGAVCTSSQVIKKTGEKDNKQQDDVYSKEEEEDVKERLKGLGYLE